MKVKDFIDTLNENTHIVIVKNLDFFNEYVLFDGVIRQLLNYSSDDYGNITCIDNGVVYFSNGSRVVCKDSSCKIYNKSIGNANIVSFGNNSNTINRGVTIKGSCNSSVICGNGGNVIINGVNIKEVLKKYNNISEYTICKVKFFYNTNTVRIVVDF